MVLYIYKYLLTKQCLDIWTLLHTMIMNENSLICDAELQIYNERS